MTKKSQLNDSLLNVENFNRDKNTSRLSVVFEKNNLIIP